MSTTFFRSNQENAYSKSEKCHDGVGPFLLRSLIDGKPNRYSLMFIHDDIVPPGSSFGLHTHHDGEGAEEWYICLSGKGTISHDGVDSPFKPGDVGVAYEGGTHGVRNTGTEDLRFLVINVNPNLAEK